MLRPLAALAVLVSVPAAAGAQGEVTFRGAYYKERATRVQQPMLDATLPLGTHGELTGHFLVDVITSASVAAGNDGQEFRETRYEHGATYMHRFGDGRAGGGYRVSTEPDYRSIFASARGEIELAQRNTVVAAAGALGFDNFDNDNLDFDAPFDPRRGKMRTAIGSASVTQVLSRHVVAGLTYDLAHIDGDQENLYRQVSVGDPLTQFSETVPDTRWRHAVLGSARTFVAPSKTALVLGYRFYRDSWKITAHTPELRAVQELATDVSLRLRYRYYRQSAAYFYRETYDRMQAYVTDDPKLGAYTTHTVGAALTARLSELGATGSLAKVRAQLLLEHITQDNRYGDAFIAQLAFAMPIEY
jgi:hypothetical protein